MFESVALGVGGAKYYNDAFVKLDPAALNSATTTKVLETFRRLKGYTDSASAGRDWNLTTAMVIQGKAGFQFMGDWAKGEFVAAGKSPGKDFLCAATPGSSDAYIFNVDSFILFKLKNIETQKAQGYFAYALMEERFQEHFNLNKGSIPVRTGTSMKKFDACAQASAADFAHTARTGTLVPSLAHGMALKPIAATGMKDVVSQFWNDANLSAAEAQKKLLALKTKPV